MVYFYKKDGEVFIPEKINPDLVKLATAVVKSCKLNFKFQLKTTSLVKALKAGKRDQKTSASETQATHPNRSRQKHPQPQRKNRMP